MPWLFSKCAFWRKTYRRIVHSLTQPIQGMEIKNRKPLQGLDRCQGNWPLQRSIPLSLSQPDRGEGSMTRRLGLMVPLAVVLGMLLLMASLWCAPEPAQARPQYLDAFSARYGTTGRFATRYVRSYAMLTRLRSVSTPQSLRDGSIEDQLHRPRGIISRRQCRGDADAY